MRVKYMRAASIEAAAAGESQENDALWSDGMKEEIKMRTNAAVAKKHF